MILTVLGLMAFFGFAGVVVYIVNGVFRDPHR